MVVVVIVPLARMRLRRPLLRLRRLPGCLYVLRPGGGGLGQHRPWWDDPRRSGGYGRWRLSRRRKRSGGGGRWSRRRRRRMRPRIDRIDILGLAHYCIREATCYCRRRSGLCSFLRRGLRQSSRLLRQIALRRRVVLEASADGVRRLRRPLALRLD